MGPKSAKEVRLAINQSWTITRSIICDILLTLVITYSLCVEIYRPLMCSQCQTQQLINISIEERILCWENIFHGMRSSLCWCQIIPHSSCRYHSCFLHFLTFTFSLLHLSCRYYSCFLHFLRSSCCHAAMERETNVCILISWEIFANVNRSKHGNNIPIFMSSHLLFLGGSWGWKPFRMF